MSLFKTVGLLYASLKAFSLTACGYYEVYWNGSALKNGTGRDF
jgi:hypothetical protein